MIEMLPTDTEVLVRPVVEFSSADVGFPAALHVGLVAPAGAAIAALVTMRPPASIAVAVAEAMSLRPRPYVRSMRAIAFPLGSGRCLQRPLNRSPASEAVRAASPRQPQSLAAEGLTVRQIGAHVQPPLNEEGNQRPEHELR